MEKRSLLKRMKTLLVTFVFLSLIVLQPAAVLAEQTESVSESPEQAASAPEASVEDPIVVIVPDVNAVEVVDEAPTADVAEEVPAADAVEEVPAADAVEEAPAADVVEEVPAADAVEEIPAADVVEEAPAADTVEEAPAADVVEEIPAANVVEEAPAADTVEEAPAADVVEEIPAADVVEEAPATDIVEEAPAADIVEEVPAADVVEEAPAADVVDETPVPEEVVETPAADVAEETPATDVVDETPATVIGEEAPAEDAGEEAPTADVVEETPAADAAEAAPAAEAADETPAEEVPAAPAADETPVEDAVPAEPVQGGFTLVQDDAPAEADDSRTVNIQVGDYIITASGAFPEGTEIQAVAIPMDTAALLAGKVPLFAYDIRLVVDGQVWQPEDYGTDVQLSVHSVNDNQEKFEANILHVKKDFLDGQGNISEEALQEALQEMRDESAQTESLRADANEGGYSFNTSSFSGFLINSTTITYRYNSTLFNNDSANYAGVYTTKLNTNTATAEEAKTSQTIGIESIADKNLPNVPTTESPAIIQGAAVGYENRLGPTEYELIDPNRPRPEPYSEFTVKIMEEQAQDGTTHKKPSGFDGTYVIIRLDVSEFMSSGNDNLYLHMEQLNNKALMPAAGMTPVNDENGQQMKDASGNLLYKTEFTDQLGNRTGSYKLSDLVDKNGTTPYLDVILYATASIVAGADAGNANVPNGDIPLALYVDDTADYNPSLTYDPQYTPQSGETIEQYQERIRAKFFDAKKAEAAQSSISRYYIKGSDLALEVSVENSAGENRDTGTSYWSLEKAFHNEYYDLEKDKDPNDPDCGRTIKMMSEVAITDQLDLLGGTEGGVQAGEVRKRTLDVNSYDVQVAKDSNASSSDSSTASSTGFTLKDAWLTLMDSSNTTGAEVAIGNNAKFIIDNGGKLIIDDTCQLEIEWDAATTKAGEPAPTSSTASGVLDLRPGGEVINNGVITIEGYEGKPQPQTTQVQETAKQCGEMTIGEGSTLTNNGAMVVNGKLYNLGTLINNGSYNDVITSNDPDAGQFNYHKGIVVAWKDDVTQSGVQPGSLINGRDSSGKDYPNALLINNGDIVLNPGTLENHQKLINGLGNSIYLGVVTEAIIPINPTAEAPTVVTKRITLPNPVGSTLVNYGLVLNYGSIAPASIVINDNGSLGALRSPGDHPELATIQNYGTILNILPEKAPKAESGLIAWKYLETESGNAWLYLYDSGVFALIFEDGTRVTGTFRFAEQKLVFTLKDGTDVEPTADENGNWAYSFPMASGTSFDFVLDSAFVSMVQERASGTVQVAAKGN